MAKRSTKKPAAPEPPEAPPTPPYTLLPLDRILGQDRAVGTLRAAINSGRIHHAWIFQGPPGVGKFTTAVSFAAALLDPSLAPDLAGDAAPDPDSRTQSLIRAGAHPDLHIITKELAAVSRVDQVRKSKQITIAVEVLREFLLEPAARTRTVRAESLAGKVFIVDEAELIQPVGQHALLKTLEEPAPGSVIILVTDNDQRLLPTVRSRCQRVSFAPLDDDAMARWLERNEVRLPDMERDWLLGFAAGSPGQARSALDHDLFEWRRTLAPMLDAAMNGVFAPELGPAMIGLIEQRVDEMVRANRDASRDAANKAWSRRMIAFVAEHARARLTSAPADPARPDTARALHVIDAARSAERQLDSNVNYKLVMENLSAQMSAEPAPI